MSNYELAIANLENAQEYVNDGQAFSDGVNSALLFAQVRATLAIFDEIRAYNTARAEESRRRAETGLTGTRDTRGPL